MQGSQSLDWLKRYGLRLFGVLDVGTSLKTAAEESNSFLGSGGGVDGSEEEEEEEPLPEEPKVPLKQQILQAKEELARLAGLINEDPEEHAGSLRVLAQISASDNVTIRKLALAT
ncbi:hypothetical protein BU16DRAFT_539387 [Lophium mytilinum]|uniref:Nucleolar complex-associated protein 3 N-terminal domain-containing protein n=1 Tax=Lophium mytilinum TaxID=390894 RepID=A0A6A6QTH4_9PEZI|nr:hypothetical protein BU16DRAFT_539387 [Lophium mytilinum]